MDNLVEIDRTRAIRMGGSLYFLVPRVIRRGREVAPGDEIIYLRKPNATDIIMRIVKKTGNADSS